MMADTVQPDAAYPVNGRGRARDPSVPDALSYFEEQGMFGAKNLFGQ